MDLLRRRQVDFRLLIIHTRTHIRYEIDHRHCRRRRCLYVLHVKSSQQLYLVVCVYVSEKKNRNYKKKLGEGSNMFSVY